MWGIKLLPVCTILLLNLLQVQSQGGRQIPDDFFHCRNEKDVDKKVSIKCDKNTQEWVLDELDPDEPPEICGADYVEEGQPETMPDTWEDLLEPCLLWSMFYGSLVTASPTTMTPTMRPVAPTMRPTTEDGEGFFDIPTLPPSPTDPPSASPTTTDPSILRINVFALNLMFPSGSTDLADMDRDELFRITQAHLDSKLRAELIGVAIDDITLEMEPARTANEASSSWTELVQGMIKFGQRAPIPSATLQTLVMEAFEDDALELYEFRLGLASDPKISQVDKVTVGVGLLQDTRAPVGDLLDNSANNGDSSSALLIVIVVCVVVGIIMACAFAYFLLYGKNGRLSKKKADRDLPDITTDPTPPDEYNAAVEYSQEEYYNTTHVPTPDEIPTRRSHYPAQPYDLNAAELSDAESSLPVDSETVTDIENQSLYSYRDEGSWVPRPNTAPKKATEEMTLQKLPRQQKVAPTSGVSVTSSSTTPSKKGLFGGLVGKYMTPAEPRPDESSHGEDEYGFDKEANPKDLNQGLSMDEGSVFIKIDDYDDNRSLLSDGRVGQILGDVRSIHGGQDDSNQNFDEIWNDDSDGDDDNKNKSREEDIREVLNTSNVSSIPFDERIRSTESRPFDENRLEQRDIVIGGSPSRRSRRVDADEISHIDEESVEDYDRNQSGQEDDSTQDGSTLGDGDVSVAEDSYGFVYQKHYHGKKKPLAVQPPASARNDEDQVNLTLPQNLRQNPVIDVVPSAGVQMEQSGDDESVEVVSIGSKTSSTTKSVSSPVKALTETPKKLLKGMSVRKKRNSDWGQSPSKPVSPSVLPTSPETSRPTSPTPSVESTDSAKFRALMREPDVYDTVPTPERKAKPEADVGNSRGPAPLLQRMPSDSDDDCYLDDDQPVIPYPRGVLLSEEKKDESSVVFSLDD